MTATFNLFDLPLLAIDNVLELMDEVSFFEFSKMSQNTKWTSKHTAIFRKPGRLVVDLAGLYPILKFESKTDGELQIGQESSKSNTVQYSCKKREYRRRMETTSSSEGCTEDILNWTQHITDIFKVPIPLLYLSSDPYEKPGTFEKIMEDVPQSEGLYVERTDGYTVDQLNILMKRAVKSKRVSINFHNSKEPTNVAFAGSNFNDFSVLGGQWITLNHILTTQFKRFFVNESKLTSENVNAIIKKWKNGWNSQMREFTTVSTFNYDESVVLEGLDAQITIRRREFEFQNFDPKKYWEDGFMQTLDGGGWEIRREMDGHLARIDVSGNAVYIYVWSPEELE